MRRGRLVIVSACTLLAMGTVVPASADESVRHVGLVVT